MRLELDAMRGDGYTPHRFEIAATPYAPRGFSHALLVGDTLVLTRRREDDELVNWAWARDPRDIEILYSSPGYPFDNYEHVLRVGVFRPVSRLRSMLERVWHFIHFRLLGATWHKEVLRLKKVR